MSRKTDAIWHRTVSPDQLNDLGRGSMVDHLGITFTRVDADAITATMPVDARTTQPFGLLHGGASVVLAETIGSTAAHACLDTDRFYAVGLEVNANHVRAVREGLVVGTGRPLHLGRRTQVWEIRIRDAEERLVCVSRLTLAVLERAG